MGHFLKVDPGPISSVAQHSPQALPLQGACEAPCSTEAFSVLEKKDPGTDLLGAPHSPVCRLVMHWNAQE